MALPFKVNVSVVIKKDTDFLLIKRADDEEVFPGLWGIPGGTVEATDPSLEDALARECMEEVAVTIGNSKLIQNNIVDKGDKAALYLVYLAEYKDGTPQPLEDTAAVEWLPIEKIRELELTPMTLDILESCL